MKKNWSSPAMTALDVRVTAAGRDIFEFDDVECGAVSGIGSWTDCRCAECES